MHAYFIIWYPLISTEIFHIRIICHPPDTFFRFCMFILLFGIHKFPWKYFLFKKCLPSDIFTRYWILILLFDTDWCLLKYFLFEENIIHQMFSPDLACLFYYLVFIDFHGNNFYSNNIASIKYFSQILHGYFIIWYLLISIWIIHKMFFLYFISSFYYFVFCEFFFFNYSNIPCDWKFFAVFADSLYYLIFIHWFLRNSYSNKIASSKCFSICFPRIWLVLLLHSIYRMFLEDFAWLFYFLVSFDIFLSESCSDNIPCNRMFFVDIA